MMTFLVWVVYDILSSCLGCELYSHDHLERRSVELLAPLLTYLHLFTIAVRLPCVLVVPLLLWPLIFASNINLDLSPCLSIIFTR